MLEVRPRMGNMLFNLQTYTPRISDPLQ